MTLTEWALTVAAGLAVVASIVIWGTAISRLKRGADLIALEPRRPVPWTFFDLALVIAAYFLFMLGGRALIEDVWRIDLPEDFRQLKPEQLAPVQLGSMGASLATVVFAVVLVAVRTGATWWDLGISLRRWPYDFALGVLGFLALAAPVYGLQAILVYFFPTMHPLVDVLEDRPDERTLVLVGLSVSVVAPIAEELFVRVLAQGWLERVVAEAAPGVFPDQSAAAIGVNGVDRSPGASREDNADSATQVANPASIADGRAHLGALRAIPIVVSALVFALLHVGHGPAPFPLFVLALGLGYLYQRTHRLWPPVVLHALLNTASLAMLWAQGR